MLCGKAGQMTGRLIKSIKDTIRLLKSHSDVPLKGPTTLPLKGFKTKLLKSTGPLKGHSGLTGGNGIGTRRAT